MQQEIIGFGSGDLTMMYDDSRPWHGSFAEYSGGEPEHVDLDVRLGRKRQLHQDIAHGHEITEASLEEHDDNKCVFRALADLTGDPQNYIEGEFEDLGVKKLHLGACPSHIEKWCQKRGLGMKWLNGGRLVKQTKPNQTKYVETQKGRAHYIFFNSRGDHFWLYKRGCSLAALKIKPAPHRLRMGARWFLPKTIPQDVFQTMRFEEVPCSDPVMVSWMLHAPRKRRRVSWSDYGDWQGEVLSGTWKAESMAQTLQALRQEGVAPRVCMARDKIVQLQVTVGEQEPCVIRPVPKDAHLLERWCKELGLRCSGETRSAGRI